MADAMLDADSGRCEGKSCGTVFAIPYFFSFQVIGCFVFLNLVVAVILENFSSLGSQNPFLVSSADIEGFKEIWAEFDPDADNFIPSSDLPRLVLTVPPPMGLKGVGDQTDARKLILGLSLKQTRGQVSFQEVRSRSPCPLCQLHCMLRSYSHELFPVASAGLHPWYPLFANVLIIYANLLTVARAGAQGAHTPLIQEAEQG